MKFILLSVIFFANSGNIFGQINLDFTKKNCFKINVYSEDHLIKTGSGFVLRSYNNFGKNICIGISNAHVLDGGDSICIQFANKQYNLTSFDFIDVEKDLISFHFQSNDYKKGFISSLEKNFSQGDIVYTMSNPIGLDYSLSKGEIASIRKDYDNEFIQFTAPASPGSSGSPLLNATGKLLGIVSKQITEGQNLNFALSVKSAQPFFAKYDSSTSLSLPNKPIKRIFNYKSEGSPIIKLLQEKIVENKSTKDVYNLLKENERYVLLDNYCLMNQIRIEVDSGLYRNALESLISYNRNFGFSSQITSLQYITLIDNIPKSDKRLLLDYLDFNNLLQNQYFTEPFFSYIQGVLNFKLEDYYNAISSEIKFTSYKDEFDTENYSSPLKHSNSLNKLLVASSYEIMADSYNKLENLKLAEQNYLNAIDNSMLPGDWCKYSKAMIKFLYNHKNFQSLCGLVEVLEKQPYYNKCDLEDIVANIKELCILESKSNNNQ